MVSWLAWAASTFSAFGCGSRRPLHWLHCQRSSLSRCYLFGPCECQPAMYLSIISAHGVWGRASSVGLRFCPVLLGCVCFARDPHREAILILVFVTTDRYGQGWPVLSCSRRHTDSSLNTAEQLVRVGYWEQQEGISFSRSIAL